MRPCATIVVDPPRFVAPVWFYQPYYAFHPRVSLGFGLWVGFPIAYPAYWGYYSPYYPYAYPYWPYGHFGFFGFGLFRLLGPIFVILLVVALARGALWRGCGGSRSHGSGVPPAFEEWHRRAHEAPGPKPAV